MRKKWYVPIVMLVAAAATWSCLSGGSKKNTREAVTEGYYQEKYRPQYHFSPPAGWMNDPNGLVYLDGEYHLFYQFFPDSTVWGPMHWGHAVSRDLIHWEHLPVALYPDSLGYIFSGSAVVDFQNTTGFGNDNAHAIIAIFTYHNPKLERTGSDRVESQAIAYSTDRGRTWTKYSGNPVLANPGKRDFRDPKVFFHEPTGKWIMILAVHDRVNLFSSPDLKKWSFESEFGEKAGAHEGVWECPDLFLLKAEESNETKWVMLVSINPGGPNGGSATQYFIGDFDGHEFFPDKTDQRWVDHGTDNYAGVTWSGIPESDGRRLFMGWMSNWSYATVVPSSVWRSAMTIPRELYLMSGKDGYSLASRPVPELELLRKEDKSILIHEQDYSGVNEISTGAVNLIQSELTLEFDLAGSTFDSLGIILENSAGERFIAGYSRQGKDFFIDRTASGDSSFSKHFAGISRAPFSPGLYLKMHIFIDAASAELFVDDGALVMTSLFFPAEEYSKLKLFAVGGSIHLKNGELRELKGIWN